MKKILIFIFFVFSIFSCATKDNNTEFNTQSANEDAERHCASHTVLQQQLESDPGLQARMDEIESFTQRYISSGARTLLANGHIQIPVVVNVLYKTAAQNISAAQIQSQIDVLNEDYAATNSEYSLIPAAFLPVASGNTNIEFVLVNTVRKSTSKSSWTSNDAMKKSANGGINPTSPTNTLNLWVCNLGGGLLGYAQFPGGPSSTDGVVCDDNAFGDTGTAASPFNKGRTATHEVGHWLNLRHIWGDTNCGSDLVSDTPVHNTSNGGCPAQPHYSTCSGSPREMTMNYMDYTNDVCMYMFSAGQKTRMNATFAAGGPRNSFAQ